jgi:hypothetical protein
MLIIQIIGLFAKFFGLISGKGIPAPLVFQYAIMSYFLTIAEQFRSLQVLIYNFVGGDAQCRMPILKKFKNLPLS